MGRCPGEQERAPTPSLGLEVDVGASHRSGQRAQVYGRWCLAEAWVMAGGGQSRAVSILPTFFKNILFCTGGYQLLMIML